MTSDDFGRGRELAAWEMVRQIVQRITQGTAHCLHWNEVSCHTPEGGEPVPTYMRTCTPNDRLSIMLLANMTSINISCATVGDERVDDLPLRQLVITFALGGTPHTIIGVQVEGHWREIDVWRTARLHDPDHVQRAVNAITGLFEEMQDMPSLDDSAPRV